MADAALDEQHLNKKSQGSQHKWKIGQMAPEQMALDELVISCCIDTPRLGKRQLCQILLKDHGNTPIGCTQTFRILILVTKCLSLENRKEEYAYLEITVSRENQNGNHYNKLTMVGVQLCMISNVSAGPSGRDNRQTSFKPPQNSEATGAGQ